MNTLTNILPWVSTYIKIFQHVVHTATKHIISRRGKHENGREMYKNDKCTCKACEKYCFSFMLNMQICDVLVTVVATYCVCNFYMIKQNVYIPLFEGDD